MPIHTQVGPILEATDAEPVCLIVVVARIAVATVEVHVPSVLAIVLAARPVVAVAALIVETRIIIAVTRSRQNRHEIAQKQALSRKARLNGKGRATQLMKACLYFYPCLSIKAGIISRLYTLPLAFSMLASGLRCKLGLISYSLAFTKHHSKTF